MPDSLTFDCFLNYSSGDELSVRPLAVALRERGITIWLKEEQLRPGMAWQELLEAGIRSSRSVAVLVGASGLGPWDEEEVRAALSIAVQEQTPVIPVLLPNAPAKELPLFLKQRTWVDMRVDTDPSSLPVLDSLIWGITGERSEDSLTTEGKQNASYAEKSSVFVW